MQKITSLCQASRKLKSITAKSSMKKITTGKAVVTMLNMLLEDLPQDQSIKIKQHLKYIDLKLKRERPAIDRKLSLFNSKARIKQCFQNHPGKLKQKSNVSQSYVYVQHEEQEHQLVVEGGDRDTLTCHELKSRISGVVGIPSHCFSLFAEGKPLYKDLSLPLCSDLHLAVHISAKGGGRTKCQAKKIHPEKICGPCSHCSKKDGRGKYHHVQSFPVNEKEWIMDKYKELKPPDCLCAACYRMLKRKYVNNSYSPLKNRKKPGRMCFLENFGKCGHTALHTLRQFDPTLFVSVFDLTDVQLHGFQGQDSVSLCREHYVAHYNHIKTRCDICNTQLPFGNCRHCPNVDKVNQYYERVGELKQVTKDSKLCESCYSKHKNIIKKSLVSNADLKNLIDVFNTKVLQLVEKVEDVKTFAINKTVICVASRMYEDKPLLLAEAVDVYKESVVTGLHMLAQHSASAVDESHFTLKNRALLSILLRHLGKYVDYYTDKSQPQLGTLLIKTGTNMMSAVLKLLHTKQHEHVVVKTEPVEFEN